METSRVDGVKAPLHNGTPRSDRRVVFLKPELFGGLAHVVEQPVPHLHLRRFEVARARGRIQPKGPRDFLRNFLRCFVEGLFYFIFLDGRVVDSLNNLLEERILALLLRCFLLLEGGGLGGGRLGLGVLQLLTGNAAELIIILLSPRRGPSLIACKYTLTYI